MATSSRGAFFANRRRTQQATRLQAALGAEAVDGREAIVTGEILRLADGSQEDGSWVAGALLSDDGSVEIPFVGAQLPGCEPGCVVRLTGRWEQHATFGLQFRASGIETTLPTRPAAVVRYLSTHVSGCGATRASQIVERFGPETLDTLAADPTTVRQVFTGRLADSLEEAVRGWAREYLQQRRAAQMAVQFMGAGMTYRRALRIQRHFDLDEAETVMLKHPYRLVEVSGIGFKIADAVAREMGVDVRDPSRIAAGLVHALQTRMDTGDSAVPTDRLVAEAERQLGLDPGDRTLLEGAVERAIASGTLVQEGDLIFLPRVVALERFVASRIALLAAEQHPLSTQERALVEPLIVQGRLSAAQARAVWMALESGVAILTGRPGSGKTTTTRTFIRACELLNRPVLLGAPTGKAASRAAEVTRIPAKTVHRLIGGQMMQRRETPLECRHLVLDETSMADLELTAWLLDNIDPARTAVLLVGDNDQLPSVGHGRVLGDLVESGVVPTIALTEIFRQAENSRIIVNAHRLLDNKPLLLTPSPDTDFLFADVTSVVKGPDGFPLYKDPERPAREQALARRKLVNAIAWLQRDRGAEPLRDIQVLSPMRRGQLGVDEINLLLQDTLNPHGVPGPRIGGGVHVRTGDRVLVTRNDYTLGVFNGDQGEVIDVRGATLTARFDDRILEFKGDALPRLRLAWAMTVHRSQGSEFPFVLLLYHTSHHVMLDRAVLYTAITRARKMFIGIGSQRAIDLTVQQARRDAGRYTGLVGRLRGLCQPPVGTIHP